MKNVTIFLAAFIFGVGLAISGMTNPKAIISFLDIFGDWNPALALVMVGAIGVNALAILFIKKQKRPVFETDFSWPAIKSVDKRLIAGSAMFGLGWGLGGFCPGPAIGSVLFLDSSIIIFIVAMMAGFALHNLVFAKMTAKKSGEN